MTDYRSTLLSSLPWLQVLDGLDRSGITSTPNIQADIPGSV